MHLDIYQVNAFTSEPSREILLASVLLKNRYPPH